MSNVSRSDENKLILLPERRAESMQPQTLNVGGNCERGLFCYF